VWRATPGGARLVTLFRLAREVCQRGVAGDIVECGTFRGGTAALLGVASRDSDKDLWLYDSFEGLPKPDVSDGQVAQHYVGAYSGSLEQVRGTLRALDVADSRTHLVKGWFEDTLPGAEVQRIALLHVDGDFYRSVRTCLETLYDRVTPGGYVVLDDYGYWPGCRLATDEFLAARGLRIKLHRVDPARRYFQKPA